jgi:hypothetical protein
VWRVAGAIRRRLEPAAGRHSDAASEPSLEGSRRLAAETVQAYRTNVRTVEGLSREFGLKSFFFWSPQLHTKRNMTDYERAWLADPELGLGSQRYVTLSRDVHDQLAADECLCNNRHFFDIGAVFDEMSQNIYVDYCHLTGSGNAIIAPKIGEVIKPVLRHIASRRRL